MASPIFPHLDQVFAAPESSQRWHRLYEALSENGAHRDYRDVVSQLEAYLAPNPESLFLRAICLHSLAPRLEYLRAAADAAQQIVPFRVERIHALLLYAWSHALTSSPTRSHFSSVMAAVDAAELLRLASRELEPYAEGKLRCRPIGELRRVAVLAADVRAINNAPTAMAVKNVGLLRDAGIEAELFAMQECDFPAIPSLPLFRRTETHAGPPNSDTDSWKPFIRDSLKAYISDPQSPLALRWRTTLLRLDAFDPDVVLFIGFFSPLPYLISLKRPLAAISVHSVPPVIPADVWLAPEPQSAGTWRSPWSDAFPPGVVHSHPFRVFVKPVGRPITRDELKLPTGAVVLLSVGYRLTFEISRPWASLMLEFLGRHPDVHWLLVGGTGTLPAALSDGPTGRIRTVPNHPEVRSICRCCDVFVNPPRVGGGFSVATAMAEGLAVVAYADSDGGDKLGDLASASDSSYFATLEALVRQPEVRQTRGAALKRRFFAELDIEQGRASLVAGCEKAIAVFNERSARQH